jgi:outer membrane lipoprotein-sorting protein
MSSEGHSSGESPTRRVFLRRAASAAAIAAVPGAVAAGCGGAGSQARLAAHRAAARRVPENSLPGDPNWWISKLGAPDEVMGYAGQSSVLPGRPVDLYVSTTAREFKVVAFRVGWYNGDLARRVWESGPVRGRRQKPAGFTEKTSTVTTDWGTSVTVPTDGWPAGSYLLRLDAHSGAQRYIPLTIRSPHTAGKVVLKNCVATWQAYNTWGGYDLYKGPDGSYGTRSLAVSLDRPYDQEGAYLFLVYERKLINLAERLGLPLAYLTSMDIASDPHALDGASALASLGHDEYWSPPERAAVTAARDAGVNLAFLGANAMFRRTRLEPTPLGADRLVICYKTSYLQDPMYGRDNALVTNNAWREPPDPDPESSVIGTLYESYPTVADYVVAAPDAWMFAGTGARKGTRFASLVGIEYDRVNPGYPVQRPIQVLSHSPLTCNGVNSYADSAYYTHRSGAGVFNAGTMRWVESFGPPLYHWGITKACGTFTRRVTANVLRAFADGPAAAKYPAHDNLDAMHEWPGDPISAGHNLWPPITLLRRVCSKASPLEVPVNAAANVLRGGRARWAVPAGAVAAVGIVIAGSVIARGQATPALPARTTAQLLAAVDSPAALPSAMTATVQETASLGLPDLPGSSDPLSGLSLLSGSHTFRIWYDGPAKVRVAVPVSMGETDLRRDGRSVWLWDSQTNQATHYILPAGAADTAPGSAPAPDVPAPPELAKQILAAVGSTTTVGLQQNVTVAGQPAYQLSLAPKDSRSLIGQVRIAIDASDSLPLQVQVFARGAASPAFSVGYTALSFARPAASNFAFSPPPGAKVKTVTVPAQPGLSGLPDLPAGSISASRKGAPPAGSVVFRMNASNGRVLGVSDGKAPSPAARKKLVAALAQSPPASMSKADRARLLKSLASSKSSSWTAYAPLSGAPELSGAPSSPSVLGKGWLSVAVLPASAAAGKGASAENVLGALMSASTPAHGAWGSGRLLRTSLLSVLMLSDGRILVGAVVPSVLYADAAQLR